MNVEPWKWKWKELFLSSLEKLPKDITLSFSGGFDSSAIFYGLHELGRKPEYCITFRVDKYESSDWYYSKKACEMYDIPLIVTEIKTKNKEELTKDCKKVMKTLGNSRAIDVQCATVFDEMMPLVPTKNFVLGFFNSASFKTGKGVAVDYSKMKRGLITPEEQKQIYDEKRNYCFFNLKYNHFRLKEFCESYGYNVFTPFYDKNLFEYSHDFNYPDFHYDENGHIFIKYFLYQIFQPYFDAVGNKHNKANMHKVSLLDDYHKKVLLPGTKWKSLSGVYNDMYRSLNQQKWF